MDIQDLISKVQLNPPIWNKRIKDYSNRNIVDACWRNISSVMKIDETLLRKKWKYLRDQFSVECSKIKPPRSGDSAEIPTEPKWPYFKRLLFLKDIVTPRASSSKLKPKSPSVTDNKEVGLKLDLSLCEDYQETNSIDFNVPKSEKPNDNISGTQPAGMNLPVSPSESHPRKKRRLLETDTLLNEQILQLEQPKFQTLLSAFQQVPDNDDMMFFKSLLPFVAKIPMEQKLRFRSQIQQIVDEFAFVGRHSLQQSPGMSTNVSTPLLSPAVSISSYDSGSSPIIDNLSSPT